MRFSITYTFSGIKRPNANEHGVESCQSVPLANFMPEQEAAGVKKDCWVSVPPVGDSSKV